jgi:uncharacterized protein YfbU (UPF0304 family)
MAVDAVTIAVASLGVSLAVFLVSVFKNMSDSKHQREALNNQTAAIKEQRKALMITAFSQMLQWIGNEDARKDRKRVWDLPEGTAQMTEASVKKELENMPEEVKKSAQDVIVMYDRVWYVISQDEEMIKHFLQHHGISAAGMWKRLERFVPIWQMHPTQYSGARVLCETAVAFTSKPKNE